MPSRPHFDWKGLGYLISIASVFFLGAVAWPKPGAPWWYLPVLIIGMACSYKAHRKMLRELRRTEAELPRS